MPPIFSAFYSAIPGDTLDEKIAAAKRIGLGACEINPPAVRSLGAALLAAHESGELQVSALVLVTNDLFIGRRSYAKMLAEALEAVEVSRDLGWRGIILADYFGSDTPGLMSEMERQDLLARLIEEASAGAGAPGSIFLIEQMLHECRPSFPTLGSAIRFIERVGPGRVKLLYDTYHLAWEGYDCLRALQDNVELVGHIHLSDSAPRDCSNPRTLPGRLEVDFAPIVAYLKARPEFEFWVVEGGPLGEDALAESLGYLRSLC